MRNHIFNGGIFIFVLVWIVVIFYLSSQPYQKQTIIPYLKSHLSENSLKNKLPDVTINYNKIHIVAKKQPFHFMEFLFRKSAHFFVYGVLGLLISLALSSYKGNPAWKIFIVVIFTAIIAVMDEWNQSASSSRTGVIQDVGVDLAGSCIGLALGMAIVKLKNLGRRV
ncbi:VanZ family protein [Paenibacillus alkalitolerans]|uniref:VanZ family protein n=1 Tax=Paenibacillus alkalitolerans TaxID=2799335 RepID=UPI0018F5F0AB|nr:VanZ family protein [Paenibacillus alkalitolerans]